MTLTRVFGQLTNMRVLPVDEEDIAILQSEMASSRTGENLEQS